MMCLPDLYLVVADADHQRPFHTHPATLCRCVFTFNTPLWSLQLVLPRLLMT